MTFEFRFNPTVVNAQYELLFRLLWKKYLRKTLWNLIMGLFVLLVGTANLVEKDSAGGIFFCLGLYMLITTTAYYRTYLKRRSAYRQLIRKIAEKRVRAADTTLYEFNDTYFRWKEMWYDYRLDWQAFSEYELIGRVLFLRLAETNANQWFMIGEDELGVEGFGAVLKFVGTKVREKVG